MPGRIVDLTALAGGLADGDLYEIVDVSVGTDDVSGSSRKVPHSDLLTWLESKGLRPRFYNASVTAQNLTTTDAYLAGSDIAIPAGALQAESMYRCHFEVTKTSTTGSTAAPALNVRFGTNGSTADTSRAALTFPAQTAVADNGFIDVYATFQTVGSGTSAVLRVVAVLRHGLSVTGLSTSVSPRVLTVGGGFDSTVASSIIGVSANFGASWAGSINLVQAELLNLT